MTCIEKQRELNVAFAGYSVAPKKELLELISMPKKKVIVLAGPTAVGKSFFGMDLAHLLDGEIVSADSMQVYKGMDIGTAKPSLKDRQSIIHHLIDICAITDPYNVVNFYGDALQACRSIIARNKTPIVVGGTGFYIHALLYGPPQGPPSSPEVRARLEEELAIYGSEHLFERLAVYDPMYAASITKNDKHKIVRALEIICLTGTKVSDHILNKCVKNEEFDFKCWFLHRPRELLYKRIEERCEQMLKEGLIEEVVSLIDKGLEINNSTAQAIGYRQALAFLRTNRSPDEYAKFVELFKQASRQYAKRQFTWFRKKLLFRWLDLDLHDHEVAREMVLQDFYFS